MGCAAVAPAPPNCRRSKRFASTTCPSQLKSPINQFNQIELNKLDFNCDGYLAVALAQGLGSGGGVAAVVRRERADELVVLLLLLLLVPRRDLRRLSITIKVPD